MFDRWILVEAWLLIGLRIRWAKSYEQRPAKLFGERANTWYAGNGEWVVIPDRVVAGYLGEFEAPEMSTDDMRHELAHWLSATPEERASVNFNALTDEPEERAITVERAIDAMCSAAARIASLAITRRA